MKSKRDILMLKALADVNRLMLHPAPKDRAPLHLFLDAEGQKCQNVQSTILRLQRRISNSSNLVDTARKYLQFTGVVATSCACSPFRNRVLDAFRTVLHYTALRLTGSLGRICQL